MPICPTCTNLFTSFVIPRFIDINRSRGSNTPLHGWHHDSWSDVISSSSSCELCELIIDESQRRKEDEFGNLPGMVKEVQKENWGKLRWQCFGGSWVDIFCVEAGNAGPEVRGWLSLGVALGDEAARNADENLRELFTGRLCAGEAGDERNVRTIKEWVRVCEIDHELCRGLDTAVTASSERHLPTRVLDVGKVGDDTVRLVLPNDDDKSAYVALSYCWGRPANPLTTTEANIEQHKTGLALQAFPQTLKDAIILTRNLGHRYIWIDALCIIQYCKEDWEREAAQMYKVYHNAALVVGSDTSDSTTTGLYTPRPARITRSVEIPIDLSVYSLSSTVGKVYLHLTPLIRWSEDNVPGTLSKRGWCFQERSLARRFVHFGALLTHFECKHAEQDEASSMAQASGGINFFHMADLMQKNSVIPTFDLHQKWARVVEDFTARALTNEEDAFPALIGIARLFEQRGSLGAYLAGLWQDKLLNHLLWQIDRSKGVVHRRPAKYRAPSWSWASVVGPIRTPAIQRAHVVRDENMLMLEELGNDRRFTGPAMRVVSMTMTTHGPTGFGEVKKALLKVTAILKEVKLRQFRGGPKFVEGDGGVMLGHAFLDVEEPSNETSGGIRAFASPVLNRLQTKADKLAESEALILQEMTGEDGTEGLGRTFKRIGHGILFNNSIGRFSFEDFTMI